MRITVVIVTLARQEKTLQITTKIRILREHWKFALILQAGWAYWIYGNPSIYKGKKLPSTTNIVTL